MRSTPRGDVAFHGGQGDDVGKELGDDVERLWNELARLGTSMKVLEVKELCKLLGSEGCCRGLFSLGLTDGFFDPDHLENVYLLRKALYGLKQAPRAWYDEISNFLIFKGFTKGDKLVSWMSKKQDCTIMSSAEAEYVALSASCAQVENGIIELYFVRTEYQLADMFTKALPEDRFQYLVIQISMRCLTPAELEVLANESA
ncbi:retrovirus-related pol polyprotein from transposon TNT 1-94 [Tanacetum coccineum]